MRAFRRHSRSSIKTYQRSTSTLRIACKYFPTEASVLPSFDPLSLPVSSHSRPPSTSSMPAYVAQLLVKNDFQSSYQIFANNKKLFTMQMLSKMLAILPSGSETAHLWWSRAQQIKSEMDNKRDDNLLLTAADYAVLINLAAQSGHYEAVELLWQEMSSLGIARDTNVWNQYIMASCDANPQFWPWPRGRSSSFASHMSRRLTRNQGSRNGTHLPRRDPGHVLVLLDRMEVEGVDRNSRTLELVLLALSREGYALNNPAILATCEQLATKLWIENKAGSQPTLSTLTAIINAWALHSQLIPGCRLVQQIATASPNSMGLGAHAAHQYWSRLFRLIISQTEPRNNVPTGFFEKVWQIMIEQHKFVPTLGCYSIKIEFLEMKNQFNEMFHCIPAILKCTGGMVLAQSVLRRAAIGLANTGSAVDAVKQLQWARELGVEPPKELEKLLADRGASIEQLALFEEDDDEDRIF